MCSRQACEFEYRKKAKKATPKAGGWCQFLAAWSWYTAQVLKTPTPCFLLLSRGSSRGFARKVARNSLSLIPDCCRLYDMDGLEFQVQDGLGTISKLPSSTHPSKPNKDPSNTPTWRFWNRLRGPHRWNRDISKQHLFSSASFVHGGTMRQTSVPGSELRTKTGDWRAF